MFKYGYELYQIPPEIQFMKKTNSYNSITPIYPMYTIYMVITRYKTIYST